VGTSHPFSKVFGLQDLFQKGLGRAWDSVPQKLPLRFGSEAEPCKKHKAKYLSKIMFITAIYN